jgi:hypothetical protein
MYIQEVPQSIMQGAYTMDWSTQNSSLYTGCPTTHHAGFIYLGLEHPKLQNIQGFSRPNYYKIPNNFWEYFIINWYECINYDNLG